ncbi:MAG: ATP-dependent Clp protease adaptor ClpS [Dehalococcoidia bacterium]|nr:ATP-dependent Clp protease adaptor ClpS [Dehalococcoidia bacterium]
MSTRPARAPDEVTKRLDQLVPRYAVILYNDDVNEMGYVVQSLLKCVPALSTQRAEEIMLETHNSGRAVVIVCPLEQAELYHDRLTSCRLTSTIEKA